MVRTNHQASHTAAKVDCCKVSAWNRTVIYTRFPFGPGVTQGSWYVIKKWKTSAVWVWPTIKGALNSNSAWVYKVYLCTGWSLLYNMARMSTDYLMGLRPGCCVEINFRQMHFMKLKYDFGGIWTPDLWSFITHRGLSYSANPGWDCKHVSRSFMKDKPTSYELSGLPEHKNHVSISGRKKKHIFDLQTENKSDPIPKLKPSQVSSPTLIPSQHRIHLRNHKMRPI